MFRRILNTSRFAFALSLTLVLFFVSCTDLEETVHSQVTSDNFFQTEEEFLSALGDAYSPLTQMGGGGGPAQFNESTTDEIIVPARGQDWSEGGFWYRMNSHRWTPDEGTFNGYWQFLYSGVNNANRLILQFQNAVDAGSADPDQAGAFISELTALRAYYYYWLLDGFGNVPLVTSFEQTDPPSQPGNTFQEGRTAVYNFVESELTSVIDDLSTDVGSTYGRMNKYVAHMTLAKLYLNSAVYLGQDQVSAANLQAALDNLNAIIDSGEYSLAANYHDNFVVDNSGSPELIFVIPYDQVFLPGFNLNVMTLHYASQNTYNFQAQPWNGWSATQKLYESVIDPAQNPGPQGEVWGTQPTADDAGLERVTGTLDDRLGNFIVGPQYSASGDRLMDSGIYSDFDRNGDPLTFTPAVNDLEAVACRQCGARIGKYEFESGIGPNMSNDFVIYRYADVLLMKAEVLWRQNPASGEALTLVNQIRNRSGVDDFGSLDGEKILAERARELFWEQVRRQDQIRFDGNDGGETDFNDPWEFKPVSESYRNVGPIPTAQLEANPNLQQNPGY